MTAYSLDIFNATNGQYVNRENFKFAVSLVIKGAVHSTAGNWMWLRGAHHNNTEMVTYDVENYLKCSHHLGNLTGVYKTEIFDRTASARYMVYVLAAVVVTGVGTAWEDIAPSPQSWEDSGAITGTWAQMASLSSGPSVSIRLYYGETSPPTSYVDRMEILSAIITGRYFQVEITITDPSTEINALVENLTIKFCQ